MVLTLPGEESGALYDPLADERQSLCLTLSMLDTLDAAPSEPGAGGVATLAEAVELVGMLPRILQSATAPAVRRQKEAQRQLATRPGIARPPPLTSATALYRLLFDPLAPRASAATSLVSTSSSRPGARGASDVLDCLAHLAMRSGRTRLEHAATRWNVANPLCDSLATASLRALRDIVELCALVFDDTDHPAARAPLLRALDAELLRSGLFAHLWRSLLFRPLADESRGMCAAVVAAINSAGALCVCDAARALSREVPRDAFADALAARILCDPCADVREALVAVVRKGFSAAEWRRVLTPAARRRMLGVVATNAFLAPREGRAVAALLCKAMREDLHAARRARYAKGRLESARAVLMGAGAEDTAEVCAAALAQCIATNRCAKTCGATVCGSVRLLRLALRVSDEMLQCGAVESAAHVVRVCVEQQGLTAALACGLDASGEAFALPAVRGEMLRLARDIAERATAPLFDVAPQMAPYIPLMLQTALDGAKSVTHSAAAGASDGSEEVAEEVALLGGALGSCEMEVMPLLAAALWHSPEMRRRGAETCAAVCHTPREWECLFDTLEERARAIPPDMVQGFLIMDASGAVVNDPQCLSWPKAQEPQSLVASLSLHLQKQHKRQHTKDAVEQWTGRARAVAEGRWGETQRQQRRELGPRHSDAAHLLVWWIFRHMRKERATAEESPLNGVTVSPILPIESHADSPLACSETYHNESDAESECEVGTAEGNKESATGAHPLALAWRRRRAVDKAERNACHRALRLFVSLASRYYRHCLSPADAAAFTASGTGQSAANGTSATLRLWTARDVRREDLFRFAIAFADVDAAALDRLVVRGQQHRMALRCALRTAPRAPCGRRWFLEDATRHIAGRVIALLQVLRRAVCREGAEAVRGVLAHMSDSNGGARALHCGNLVEAAGLILERFAHASETEREAVELLKQLDGEVHVTH